MSGHEEAAVPPVAAVRELAFEGEAAVGSPVAIPPRTFGQRARRVVLYGFMIAIALLYLVPFVYTVSTSFKTQAEAAAGFDLWPDQASLAAYREIWSREDLSFVTFFKNSLLLATAITVITLFLATLGGYAFARLRFPFREPLFLVVLGTLMIPDQLRLVPVYLMMVDFPLTGWNLTQTLHGYVFFGSSIALATSLFLMRQYFLTIPKDYEEAAKLDGAGYFKTYWRIMLPLAAPAVAAVAILTFQGIWNEFFWANLLLTGDSSNYTIQMGLVQFRFQYQTLWPQLMAATTIAIIPVLVVYVFFQRYFVAGVAAAGGEGMTTTIAAVREPGVGEALRRALRDFYEESWRLVLLNSLLSAYVLAVLALATFVPVALVLLVGAGWPAAALVSAAVIVVETGSLTFVEVAESLRRSWRRGIVLAGALAGVLVATVVSFRFYGDVGALTWPLAVVVLYLAAIFLVYQVLLWPLAVRDHDRPLRDVAAETGIALLRRPFPVLGLALELLVINLAGLVLAVLPLLTMTIAYSALAAARFALAPAPVGEA